MLQNLASRIMGGKSATDSSNVDLNSLSLDDIVANVSAALAFEGFDPVKMRALAVSMLTERELIILLTAYVMTGNALAVRTSRGKVVSKEMADLVLGIMRAKKITTRAKKSTEMTLPRLAITFPALVIAIRFRTPSSQRIETSTPWELQDLCLNGYAETPAGSGSDDFIRKFTLVLNKAANMKLDEKLRTSEVDALNRMANFRETAKVGLSRDPIGAHLMSKKITKEQKLHDLARVYGMKSTVAAPAVALPSVSTVSMSGVSMDAIEVPAADSSPVKDRSRAATLEEEGTKLEPEVETTD